MKLNMTTLLIRIVDLQNWDVEMERLSLIQQWKLNAILAELKSMI